MNNTLVTLAFDRMKRLELQVMYDALSNCFAELNVQEYQLEWALNHFSTLREPVNKVLSNNDSLIQIKALSKHYKAVDNLMSSFLQHTKALMRVDFEDISSDAKTIYNFLTNKIKYDVHAKQISKITCIKLLLQIENHYMQHTKYFTHPEFTRYTVALKQHLSEIRKLDSIIISHKAKHSAGSTIKNKQEFIKGMQTFLTAYKLLIIQHPDIDYKPITSYINIIFVGHRAQLRNRTTRRLRKSEKLQSMNKSVSEDVENDG